MSSRLNGQNCAVKITIPAALSRKSHILYSICVEVNITKQEWSVNRRYSQLLQLKNDLIQVLSKSSRCPGCTSFLSSLTKFEFPGKSLLHSTKLIRYRVKALQKFLTLVSSRTFNDLPKCHICGNTIAEIFKYFLLQGALTIGSSDIVAIHQSLSLQSYSESLDDADGRSARFIQFMSGTSSSGFSERSSSNASTHSKYQPEKRSQEDLRRSALCAEDKAKGLEQSAVLKQDEQALVGPNEFESTTFCCTSSNLSFDKSLSSTTTSSITSSSTNSCTKTPPSPPRLPLSSERTKNFTNDSKNNSNKKIIQCFDNEPLDLTETDYDCRKENLSFSDVNMVSSLGYSNNKSSSNSSTPSPKTNIYNNNNNNNNNNKRRELKQQQQQQHENNHNRNHNHNYNHKNNNNKLNLAATSRNSRLNIPPKTSSLLPEDTFNPACTDLYYKPKPLPSKSSSKLDEGSSSLQPNNVCLPPTKSDYEYKNPQQIQRQSLSELWATWEYVHP